MEYMKLAIEKAKETSLDIPVGAVIVKDGEILALTHNTKEEDNDITSHAEILALRLASKKLNNWRLNGCEIYVTLEPCPMCGWAIIQSGIKKIYYGSADMNYGAFTVYNMDKSQNIKIYSGIMEDECNEILKTFFAKIRK